MDESEFRGSTKQSLMDIRDDIVELKATLNAFMKYQGERDERLADKFVSRESQGQLERIVISHGEEIENIKKWRLYITGAWTVIVIIATMFSDEIKRFIFK